MVEKTTIQKILEKTGFKQVYEVFVRGSETIIYDTKEQTIVKYYPKKDICSC